MDTKSLEDIVEELKKGSELDWDTRPIDFGEADWVDETIYREGRKFVKENYYQQFFHFAIAMTVGLCVDELVRPLIYSKRSSTPETSAVRYASTLRHIMHWSCTDIVRADRENIGRRSLDKVNHTHGAMKRMMESKSPGYRYFSQYSMCLVQSGFIGGIVLYPKLFGLPTDKRKLSSFIHLWHIIAKGMGIDDEYNLCIPEDFQTVHRKCKAIEQCVLLPLLCKPSPEFLHMSFVFAKSMNYLLPFRFPLYSRNALLRMALMAFGANDRLAAQLYPLSWVDILRVGVMAVLNLSMHYLPWFYYPFRMWFYRRQQATLHIDQLTQFK